MTLYRKLIRPIHCYPGRNYEPLTEPVEKEEKWYPEEERKRLEKEYGYLNDAHFSDLVFEEKYEPYAVEPQFKKLKVPEKCKECKSCQVAINGSLYCTMGVVSSDNPQMNISTICVDPDLRPIWCPIIKMNNELDEMPIEKRSNIDKLITGLTSLFGEEIYGNN